MRKFEWRLQRVLDIKKKEEQTKRAELLELTEKLALARSELLFQKKILENLIMEISTQENRERLKQQEFFLKCSKTNNERIKALTEKARQLETQQKTKIVEVLKVRRFKEGLEKLREEAKTKFFKEAEKLEQKELDERATIRFVRNKLSKENSQL
jgi:flagellar biosynthesis chaperone FliJ